MWWTGPARAGPRLFPRCDITGARSMSLAETSATPKNIWPRLSGFRNSCYISINKLMNARLQLTLKKVLPRFFTVKS